MSDVKTMEFEGKRKDGINILIEMWEERLKDFYDLMECYRGSEHYDEYKGKYSELERCIKEVRVFGRKI